MNKSKRHLYCVSVVYCLYFHWFIYSLNIYCVAISGINRVQAWKSRLLLDADGPNIGWGFRCKNENFKSIAISRKYCLESVGSRALILTFDQDSNRKFSLIETSGCGKRSGKDGRCHSENEKNIKNVYFFLCPIDFVFSVLTSPIFSRIQIWYHSLNRCCSFKVAYCLYVFFSPLYSSLTVPLFCSFTLDFSLFVH